MKWLHDWVNGQWTGREARVLAMESGKPSGRAELLPVSQILKHLDKWKRREDPLHPKCLVPS